ncbi:RAMP superfamily CRISPR-associated protein [Pasteurella atlantica]|uniref:RAMP superfamily CRISPR-associated protein n=1 Tax=Pasteurellaceae TaxID=712 RepID=UPI00274322E4|nr:RAMP superfamily CRISPR-associated protein [Pasteurella atlantica]MDP8033562.1 RAMP superfamily CRISPR-associated protein [Pasteurella atlantica]MDP8035497.1 RAMP superfamily CRISPR-associated protein [Pasteurella atlantica]MDP8037448.1 RAMP superfamily CRISPR-associated protein [Pasteurella atlantica]MDP8047797.1 RAMP superfamily CRISPR-associated protein [Pasteurella atlantica]MDP8049642.1 RAMP superfamily CRISPR-associated protein [Pasteurella atlantica]
MKEFMKTHQVYLTPLTPIHIGCGEEFEPTNYVIDDNVLYHFEPSKLPLNEYQQDDLYQAVQRNDLLSVQKFYKDNAKQYSGISHYFSKISDSFADEWQNLGKVAQREKNGNKVINNFVIERQSYSSLLNQPYIPASSVKGALVTAYLDYCHQQKGNPKYVNKRDDKDLKKEYVGDFAKSRYRHLSFGDFMPTYKEVGTKIYYAVNHQRKLSDKKREGNPYQRRESILGGQYRSFKAEISIKNEKFNFIKELDILQKYSLDLFEEELNVLFERNLISVDTKKALSNIVTIKNTYLVRLGKNGADSKIYRGQDVAKINIPQLRKSLNRPLTWWLAGDNKTQSTDLLPFGWALLEIDPNSDNNDLKEWCNKNKVNSVNFDEIYQNQKQVQEQIKLIEQEQQQKLVQEQQALKEEQERQASLSENQRKIEQTLKAWDDYEVKRYTDNSQVFVEAQELVKTAISENWDQNDKALLRAIFDYSDEKSVFNRKVEGLDLSKSAGKLKGKAKEFKQLLNQLQE